MICLKPGSSSTSDLGRYCISSGNEQRGEVAVGLGGKTLKPAEAVKLGAGNDQDTFVDFWAHQLSSRGIGANRNGLGDGIAQRRSGFPA